MSDERMTDDTLDRMLRSTSPYARDAGAALSVRAEADLARMLAGRGARATRRRRAFGLSLGLSLPAIAAAVIALVVVLVANPFTPPAPAAAQGLRPLQYNSSGLTVDAAIDEAQALLGRSDGPAEPLRHSVTVAWYANVQMDGPDAGVVMSPEVTTWEWDETLNGRVVVTAGEAFSTEGDAAAIPTREDLAAPGTVLREEQIGPEYLTYEAPDGIAPLPFTEEGASVGFFRDVIAWYTGTDQAASSDVLTGVGELLNYWTYTNEQHASLLEVVRAQSDLELLGTTTDRAGRPAFAIAATSPAGHHQLALLVSTETGRIIGAETVYLGGVPDGLVPANSVFSYSLWGTDPAAE